MARRKPRRSWLRSGGLVGSVLKLVGWLGLDWVGLVGWLVGWLGLDWVGWLVGWDGGMALPKFFFCWF